ncbi:4'-phosphopantetheinyl transferase superfamily protein [Candidatus Saccharibacteria bacterium]|nr:4'-phosphopantetheinyl transferase superfamily protein [Candidatus Saccharibacteria bacterium]
MKIYFIKTDNNAEKLSSVLFPLIYKREAKESIDIPYQQIKRNQYGKPLPIQGIYYNISHTKKMWCIVFCDSQCGIDIEKSKDIDERIKRRILSKNEKIIGGNILNNWVIKEAYGKYLGLGLNIDFRDISTNDIMEHENVTNLSTNDYVCFVVSKIPSDIEVTYLKEEDLVKAGC